MTYRFRGGATHAIQPTQTERTEKHNLAWAHYTHVQIHTEEHKAGEEEEAARQQAAAEEEAARQKAAEEEEAGRQKAAEEEAARQKAAEEEEAAGQQAAEEEEVRAMTLRGTWSSWMGLG